MDSCCTTHDATHHHAHGGSHSHGSHAHAMQGHGSAQGFLRRFWIVTVLLVPLALTNDMVAGFLGIPAFSVNRWVQFGIATVIFGFALVFFQHAWHEIKARKYGMMTLVSLAVAAGYGFSVVATLVPSLQMDFYLEIATLIWVLLFGHYLEAKSSSAAGDALKEVQKLLPQTAHKVEGSTQRDVPVAELLEGDAVLVRPGEKIPADGTITDGSAHVDESLVSGESKPIGKRVGDAVVAGSLNLDGVLTITLTRVGEHSTVGQIQTLIANAQKTKPRSQRIADRAAGVLTFVALGAAVLTVVVWTFFLGETFLFGATLAITVLVIACPHALGLAIPTVTTIATSLSVKNGVFIKDLSKLEVIKKTDHVVFDKTGTLTKGAFGVTDTVALIEGVSQERVLSLAASLDQHSTHVVGKSILAHAQEKGVALSRVEDLKHSAGRGSEGVIDGRRYAVGNARIVSDDGTLEKHVQGVAEKFERAGKTVVFVSEEGRVIGSIALADEIREESRVAVERLHALGVGVTMLTGDNEDVARSVAHSLGIDRFVAKVQPSDKYEHVKKLQAEGHTVLMVGDGVNDGPALTQADVGVAIGSGTDIAVAAGDVVLTRGSIADVVRMLVLAKKVHGKMVQNLLWALGYNVFAIPAAAGAFAFAGVFLRPEIGALLMSGSTVIVVLNAMLLKRVNLEVV